MIAHVVVRVLVAAVDHRGRARDGVHFLVEDLVAQLLCAAQIAPGAREAHLEIADPAIDFRHAPDRDDRHALAAFVAEGKGERWNAPKRARPEFAGDAPRT